MPGYPKITPGQGTAPDTILAKGQGEAGGLGKERVSWGREPSGEEDRGEAPEPLRLGEVIFGYPGID